LRSFERDEEKYGPYITDRSPAGLLHELLALQTNDNANALGCVILVNMWEAFASATESMPEYDHYGTTDELLIQKFVELINSLERSDTTKTNPNNVAFLHGFDSQRELFQASAATGFSTSYLDPHNAVPYYCKEIHGNMRAWQNNNKEFKGPFSSLLSSSMTGKSRLLKEIAMNIPTVYIFLRDPELELETSYPGRSHHRLVDYLLQNDSRPSLRTTNQPQDTITPEAKTTRRFKIFLCALVDTINVMAGSDDDPWIRRNATAEEVREFLWYLFAEHESNRFSEICERGIAKPNDSAFSTYLKASTILMGKITQLQTQADSASDLQEFDRSLHQTTLNQWHSTRYVLKCWAAKEKDEMLLIVWDEARTLVKTVVDGQKFESQLPFQNSKFRCLQRAIREVGRLQYTEFSPRPAGPAATGNISSFHRYYLPDGRLSAPRDSFRRLWFLSPSCERTELRLSRKYVTRRYYRPKSSL